MKLFCIIVIASLSSALQMIAANSDPLVRHDVAGDYHFGDGLGANFTLKLSVEGRFRFALQGCLGTYDTNEGDFSLKHGILRITPEKLNIHAGTRGRATDFYPIRWGSRMYLVPTNDIIEFCSSVNQGGEPRRLPLGQYYLRWKDWNNAVAGKPAVPEQWTKFLLTRPVKGKITELVVDQEAWVDVGADDGILSGMILTASDHRKRMFSQIRVETVEKRRCRIKCQWPSWQLGVGWTVSSRFQE